MSRLRTLTMRQRLLLASLVSTLLALGLVMAGMHANDMRGVRTRLGDDAQLLAQTIAWHARPSLAFGHESSAREALASLSIFPFALGGAIRDTDGVPLANWPADRTLAVGPEYFEGVRFEEERLVARSPVVLDGERIGEVVLAFTLEEIHARESEWRRTGAAALVVGLLIAGLLAWWLHRQITRPIRELSSAVRRVSQERDYSAHADSTGDSEVGLLVKAFNEMLDSLESREAEVGQAREQAESAARAASDRAEEIEDANLKLRAEIRERQALEEQLLQSQKMESVGRLAGGVAHDFNNLLTVILGWLDVVRDEETGTVRDESLLEIRRAAERAANLTRSLLAFARRQPLEAEVVDPNALVSTLDGMLRRVLGDDVELQVRLEPGIHRIKVDRGLFEQILVNLALNARDAMPAGGTLRIETANVVRAEADRLSEAEPPAGDYAMLSVSDTGTGMDPEVVRRIFEPFFTTKPPGKGIGLGLAMVYGIVRQAGGKISVHSVPGEGTVFEVLVPRTAEPLPETTVPAAERQPEGGSERILLVEDELAVRVLVRRVLRHAGYEVLEATDGLDAQRVAAAAPGPIDLLVSDIVMPRLGGPELAAELRRDHPELRILFTSGYAEEVLERGRALPPGASFLPKPFTPRQLAARIREVLGGPAPRPTEDSPARAKGESR